MLLCAFSGLEVSKKPKYILGRDRFLEHHRVLFTLLLASCLVGEGCEGHEVGKPEIEPITPQTYTGFPLLYMYTPGKLYAYYIPHISI